MLIREKYLNKLIEGKDLNLIKVITEKVLYYYNIRIIYYHNM